MKKIFTLPLLYFFLLVAMFYLPIFIGKLPIPSDTLVSLYHPYRDLYAGTNPRGVVYKNPLITDPIRQQYPWKNISIGQLRQGILPSWNPYAMSGVPLLANFQSAPFYPLNIVFLFLPFSIGWSLLIAVQTLLAGVWMYVYLRNLRLNEWACLLGGIVFAFSGFSIAWLEWGTILQTILWLPLLLLAIDKLLLKFTRQWIAVFLFASASMVFAGHLQTCIYGVTVASVYLMVRVVQVTFLKRQELSDFVRRLLPFLGIGVIALGITAIQWLPTFHFVSLSARSLDQLDSWKNVGWFLPWQHLIQLIIPDFFGNPATGNYWGVWNYGEFASYIGIFPLLIALIGMVARRDKKTYFFITLFLLSLILMTPNLIAKLPYLLHIPFLSSTQPTRLLAITDFALAVLSALGLDYFFRRNLRQLVIPIIFLGVILSGLAIFLYTPFANILSAQNVSVARHNMILPLVFYVISAGLLVYSTFISDKKLIVGLIVAFLVLSAFDLLRFAQKFTPFTPPSYLYPSTKTLTFLQNHVDTFRIMSLDSRILPPNVTGMYHLQSVDGYDPLYLARYGELIIASERGTPDIKAPFGFNRIITPHNFTTFIPNLLGVKYVLSLNDLNNAQLRKVFQEGETRVYENTAVYPRTFFVESVIKAANKQDTIGKMFHEDLRTKAVVEPPYPPVSLTTGGSARIIDYSAEKVTIETENSGAGFLILTDAYYPSWKAEVRDQGPRKPLHIYRTDYNFRGVIVPAGKHTIVFYNGLL